MKVTLKKQGEEVLHGLGTYYFEIEYPDLGYEFDNCGLIHFDLFAEDSCYYPHLPPLLRAIRNYQKLLNYWITQVQGLPIETVAYLPLGFHFDKYQFQGFIIGGFSVRNFDGNFLIVHNAYTNIYRGSTLYPSDYLEGRVHMTEGNFREDSTEYVLIKTDFVKHMQAAIEDLEQQYVAMLL
jgi:hypothetical protein